MILYGYYKQSLFTLSIRIVRETDFKTRKHKTRVTNIAASVCVIFLFLYRLNGILNTVLKYFQCGRWKITKTLFFKIRLLISNKKKKKKKRSVIDVADECVKTEYKLLSLLLIAKLKCLTEPTAV